MKLLKEKIDKIKNEDVKNLFLERYDDLNFLYSIKILNSINQVLMKNLKKLTKIQIQN